MSDHLINTYKRQPVAFERGQGAQLWDTEGNEYLDALAGIAVLNLGHSHPKVTQAICEQAQKLIQVSNGYEIPDQSALAEKLAHVSGLDQAFFCNSGTEAIEAAIKLARRYGKSRGYESPQIITMQHAFHGRTFGAISATPNPMVQKDFDPLLPGFLYCPYNDLEAVEQMIAEQREVCAIMLEPIQGEGGIFVPDDGYLRGIRDLCDEHNLLMITDEIQTGVGRTGRFFAYQHENIIPDVCTSAKGLGNGYPIGAMLTKAQHGELLPPGSHGTTFGGSPLASHVGLAVINTIEQEHICENATHIGAYLKQALQDALQNRGDIIQVRGKGLMIGVEFDQDCTHLRLAGLRNGLVFNVTHRKIVRLVPPLIITTAQADTIVERLKQTIEENM